MHTTQKESQPAELDALRSRARECLLGQLAGDALGSLVEFKTGLGGSPHHRHGHAGR